MRGGDLKERSRLRPLRPSQDRVGVSVQGFLPLLAKPRAQHHKRSRKKRDSADSQTRIYFGSRTTAPGTVQVGRRYIYVAIECKRRRSQRERQPQHQCGGLPFCDHGILQRFKTGTACTDTRTRQPRGLYAAGSGRALSCFGALGNGTRCRRTARYPTPSQHRSFALTQAGMRREGPVKL